MTKNEAVKILRTFGFARIERDFRETRPQGWCDRILMEAAEDGVEGLIALGILQVEAERPA